jgi:pyrroloquinoline quinone biosynthesis protein D
MTTALLDSDVPVLAPTFRFQWEEVQGCWVILYPEGMVKLSPSAAEILKRCDGARTVAALLEDLKSAYPGADLEGDVRKFLEDAHEHGWIRNRDG